MKTSEDGSEKSSDSIWSKIGHRLFIFLSTMQLGNIVLVLLTLALIVATVLESRFDTPTAQFWVYRAFWFYIVLGLLGINIFVVAISRFPWKKHHTPFLLAHSGILVLLFGSWLTFQFGLDGSMRIKEGEVSDVVEVNEPKLIIYYNPSSNTLGQDSPAENKGNKSAEKIIQIPIPWRPPGFSFRPIQIPELGLTVDQYISRADSQFEFIEADTDGTEVKAEKKLPAFEIEISGGLMPMAQKFWVWLGSSQTRFVQAGPAKLFFFESGFKESVETEDNKLELGKYKDTKASTQGMFVFEWNRAKNTLDIWARSSRGEESKLELNPSQFESSKSIAVSGWKTEFKITRWIENAVPNTIYVPARVEYGPMAPSSAIHLISGKGGKGSEIWLGLGDRATLSFNGKDIVIGYQPMRVKLPFGIQLDKFEIERYEGTMNPKEYRSFVKVKDGENSSKESLPISMNEPLTYGGVTFYQSSYEEAEPRPVVSIFSVNKDPGRKWKYVGSIMLVLGIILLFAAKLKKNRVKKVGSVNK